MKDKQIVVSYIKKIYHWMHFTPRGETNKECSQIRLDGFLNIKVESPYLSSTLPLEVVGVAMSPSDVPFPWLRLGLQTLLTEAEEKSSGGSSGQPNCSLVLP